MSNISSKKIYFYTTSSLIDPNSGAWFQDLIVNLAEGFNQLGVQYYSNNNYWRLSPYTDEYLLKSEPNCKHQDCDIVVLERQYIEENNAFPDDLFTPNRQYITVYLDCADGIFTKSWQPEFRQFDFIFKTHFVSHIKYPSNCYPWAFGLSRRVLNELVDYTPIIDRKNTILINFRHHPKYSHSLRKHLGKTFPHDIQEVFSIDSSTENKSKPPQDSYHNLQWFQTAGRHYPSYYKRLQESTACACFGGFFVGPQVADFYPNLSRYIARILSKLEIKSNRITQWDSWRFWESLAAGCITFHVDFEKYGFVLPVQIRNWEHYIGLDLDNIQASIERIKEEPEILENVSIQGKNWAIENYSPKAVAQRFMSAISKASM